METSHLDIATHSDIVHDERMTAMERIILSYLVSEYRRYDHFVINAEKLCSLYNIEKQRLRIYFKKFVKLGYVENITDASIIKSIVARKDCSGIKFGEKICEWCGIGVLCTEAHHYPVQLAHGGKDVVNICPNCHKEFHLLCNYTYKIAEKSKPLAFYVDFDYNTMPKVAEVRGI